MNDLLSLLILLPDKGLALNMLHTHLIRSLTLNHLTCRPIDRWAFFPMIELLNLPILLADNTLTLNMLYARLEHGLHHNHQACHSPCLHQGYQEQLHLGRLLRLESLSRQVEVHSLLAHSHRSIPRRSHLSPAGRAVQPRPTHRLEPHSNRSLMDQTLSGCEAPNYLGQDVNLFEQMPDLSHPKSILLGQMANCPDCTRHPPLQALITSNNTIKSLGQEIDHPPKSSSVRPSPSLQNKT